MAGEIPAFAVDQENQRINDRNAYASLSNSNEQRLAALAEGNPALLRDPNALNSFATQNNIHPQVIANATHFLTALGSAPNIIQKQANSVSKGLNFWDSIGQIAKNIFNHRDSILNTAGAVASQIAVPGSGQVMANIHPNSTFAQTEAKVQQGEVAGTNQLVKGTVNTVNRTLLTGEQYLVGAGQWSTGLGNYKKNFDEANQTLNNLGYALEPNHIFSMLGHTGAYMMSMAQRKGWGYTIGHLMPTIAASLAGGGAFAAGSVAESVSSATEFVANAQAAFETGATMTAEDLVNYNSALRIVDEAGMKMAESSQAIADQKIIAELGTKEQSEVLTEEEASMLKEALARRQEDFATRAKAGKLSKDERTAQAKANFDLKVENMRAARRGMYKFFSTVAKPTLGLPFGAVRALANNGSTANAMALYASVAAQAQGSPETAALWRDTMNGAIDQYGRSMGSFGQSVANDLMSKDNMFYNVTSGSIDLYSNYVASDPFAFFGSLGKTTRSAEGFAGSMVRFFGDGLGVRTGADVFTKSVNSMTTMRSFKFMAEHSAEAINEAFPGMFEGEAGKLLLRKVGKADSVSKVMTYFADAVDAGNSTMRILPTLSLWKVTKAALRDPIIERFGLLRGVVGELLPLPYEALIKVAAEVEKDTGVNIAPSDVYEASVRDMSIRSMGTLRRYINGKQPRWDFIYRAERWFARNLAQRPTAWDPVAQKYVSKEIIPGTMDGVRAIQNLLRIRGESELYAKTVGNALIYTKNPDDWFKVLINSDIRMLENRLVGAIPGSTFHNLIGPLRQTLRETVSNFYGYNGGGSKGVYTHGRENNSMSELVDPENPEITGFFGLDADHLGSIHLFDPRQFKGFEKRMMSLLLDNTQATAGLVEKISALSRETLENAALYKDATIRDLASKASRFSDRTLETLKEYYHEDYDPRGLVQESYKDSFEDITKEIAKIEKDKVSTSVQKWVNAYDYVRNSIRDVEKYFDEWVANPSNDLGGLNPLGFVDGVFAKNVGHLEALKEFERELAIQVQSPRLTDEQISAAAEKYAKELYPEQMLLQEKVKEDLTNRMKAQKKKLSENYSKAYLNVGQRTIDRANRFLSQTFVPMALFSGGWSMRVALSEYALNSFRFGPMELFDAKLTTSIAKHAVRGTDLEKVATEAAAKRDEVFKSTAAHIFNAVREPDGGMTIKLPDGTSPTDGYMVAHSNRITIFPSVEEFADPVKSEQILKNYYNANKDLFEKGDHYLGVWHNPDTGQIHLEVSQNIADEAEALFAGRERNQYSVYALNPRPRQKRFVYTGGTGKDFERDANISAGARFIRHQTERFHESGGTIEHAMVDDGIKESLLSESTIRELDRSYDEARLIGQEASRAHADASSKFVDDYVKANPGGKYSDALKALDDFTREDAMKVASLQRTSQRAIAFVTAIKEIRDGGYNGIIANDAEGNAVAAISYNFRKVGDSNYVSIGWLGSLPNDVGAGTALQYEIAKIAAEKNATIESAVGFDSYAYHRLIGRNLSGGGSNWTKAQVKEIANLKMGEPLGKHLTDAVRTNYSMPEMPNRVFGKWKNNSQQRSEEDLIKSTVSQAMDVIVNVLHQGSKPVRDMFAGALMGVERGLLNGINQDQWYRMLDDFTSVIMRHNGHLPGGVHEAESLIEPELFHKAAREYTYGVDDQGNAVQHHTFRTPKFVTADGRNMATALHEAFHRAQYDVAPMKWDVMRDIEKALDENGANKVYTPAEWQELKKRLEYTAYDRLNNVYSEESLNRFRRNSWELFDPSYRTSLDPTRASWTTGPKADWARALVSDGLGLVSGIKGEGYILHEPFIRQVTTGEIEMPSKIAQQLVDMGKSHPRDVIARGFQDYKRWDALADGSFLNEISNLGHDKVFGKIVNSLVREPVYLLEYHLAMEGGIRDMVSKNLMTLDQAEVMADNEALRNMKKYVHNPMERTSFENNIRVAAPFYFAQNQAWRRALRVFEDDPGAFERYLKMCLAVTNYVSINTKDGTAPSLAIPGSQFLLNMFAGVGMDIGTGFNPSEAALMKHLGFGLSMSEGSVSSVIPTGGEAGMGIFNEITTPSWGPLVSIPLKLIGKAFVEHPGYHQFLERFLGKISSNSGYFSDILPSTLVRDVIGAVGDIANIQHTGAIESIQMSVVNDAMDASRKMFYEELNASMDWKGVDEKTKEMLSAAYVDMQMTKLMQSNKWTDIMNKAHMAALTMYLVKAAIGFGSPAALSVQDKFSADAEFQKIMNSVDPTTGQPYTFMDGSEKWSREHPYNILDLAPKRQGARFPENVSFMELWNRDPSAVLKYPNLMAVMTPRNTGYTPGASQTLLAAGINQQSTMEQYKEALLTQLGNDYYYNFLEPYYYKKFGTWDRPGSEKNNISSTGQKQLTEMAQWYSNNWNSTWYNNSSFGGTKKNQETQVIRELQDFVNWKGAEKAVGNDNVVKLTYLLNEYTAVAQKVTALTLSGHGSAAYQASDEWYKRCIEWSKNPIFKDQEYLLSSVLSKIPTKQEQQ